LLIPTRVKTVPAQQPPAVPATALPPSTHTLSVTAISKSYGNRQVLHDFSLHVAHGEIVGLLGPNGAGKTIGFYAIIGMIAVDSGHIKIGETDVTNLPMSARALLGLGYLPQEASIFSGMTVAENIRAVLELFEDDDAKITIALEDLLHEFRIDHVRDTSAIALSGGERRRCEIARAVAAKPSILLLDEPFAGVDPLSVTDIMTMVRDLKKRDIGILITDHNVHEMMELVDRAYVIYQGRMLFEGTPEALMADPQVRHNYLGDDFEL
jgi:lipopolysaccharide export system ATP-binding protein